jgi:acetyl esterase
MAPEHMPLEENPAESCELDPEMRIVLARMLERMASRPPLGTSTPAEMRARFADDIVAWNADPPDVPLIADSVVPTANRRVPVRFYDPVGDGTLLPTLIYFHGGGWVVGDLDSNDRALRLLALHSGVAILSVDYCLAPEHPFPAPLHECLEVARWVRRHGASHGIDVDRLAIGGDSAGANLALATALDLRDTSEQWLRYMLLVYGVYAREHETASHRRFGDGQFGFGTEAMGALWSMYLGREGSADDPRAAPLRARLDNLPPACIVAGQLDPLRDDSRRLGGRLIAAGGSVDYLEYPGVIHGFMSMTRDLAVARRATASVADSLRRGLSSRASSAPGL